MISSEIISKRNQNIVYIHINLEQGTLTRDASDRTIRWHGKTETYIIASHVVRGDTT
jgi:hypothetical protein